MRSMRCCMDIHLTKNLAACDLAAGSASGEKAGTACLRDGGLHHGAVACKWHANRATVPRIQLLPSFSRLESNPSCRFFSVAPLTRTRASQTQFQGDCTSHALVQCDPPPLSLRSIPEAAEEGEVCDIGIQESVWGRKGRMAGKGMRIGAANLPAPTFRACGFLGSVLSVAAKARQANKGQEGLGSGGRIRCVFLVRPRNV